MTTEDQDNEYTASLAYREGLALQTRLWRGLDGLDHAIATRLLAGLPDKSALTVADLQRFGDEIKAMVWQRVSAAADTHSVAPEPRDPSEVQPVRLPAHWRVSGDAGDPIVVLETL